jgi:hypothetical protein
MPAQSSPSSHNVNTIATPPPAEPQYVAVSETVFPPEDDKSHLDAPCLSTPGQSLPTCGVLPQPVANGRMSPVEVSSAHPNIAPQPCGAIPNQSTTSDIGQDSRPALPPVHPLLQPLPKVSFDPFNFL